MVNIAENDRRMREAEEKGRRQAEETLEKREDLLYQEIMKVHQGTVDTFLDVMFNSSVETGIVLLHFVDYDSCFEKS